MRWWILGLWQCNSNVTHRMPVGKFRVGDIARGAVRPLAPGAPVTFSVAGSLPGLRSRFQYSDHDRRLPLGLRAMGPPHRINHRCGRLQPMDCRCPAYQFQMAATRYANWVFDSLTSTISAGTSPRIPNAIIQFRISWSPESWISSGVSSASLLPLPPRTISR